MSDLLILCVISLTAILETLGPFLLPLCSEGQLTTYSRNACAGPRPYDYGGAPCARGESHFLRLSMNGASICSRALPVIRACATCCGADRDRTDDLRLAKPALSQLSYSPVFACPVLVISKCEPEVVGGPARVLLRWARADLNCRPHAYQACALTT
jgi:hypothetical protein